MKYLETNKISIPRSRSGSQFCLWCERCISLIAIRYGMSLNRTEIICDTFYDEVSTAWILIATYSVITVALSQWITRRNSFSVTIAALVVMSLALLGGLVGFRCHRKDRRSMCRKSQRRVTLSNATFKLMQVRTSMLGFLLRPTVSSALKWWWFGKQPRLRSRHSYPVRSLSAYQCSLSFGSALIPGILIQRMRCWVP